MPNCKSCDSKVLRTDAFCGKCGEPVPGAKPVVPISRQSKPSGMLGAAEDSTGRFPPQAGTGTSAQAAAAVVIADPEASDLPNTGLSRTALREQEPSQPAPVLPLHRKKTGATSDHHAVVPETTTEPKEQERPKTPSRSVSMPHLPVPPGPPILASDLLRRQMRPTSPGENTLRWVAVGSAAACAIVALVVGGVHPLTLVSLALLVTLASLALTPMSYAARATSLFLLGSVATGVALGPQRLQGLSPENIFLAGATILLSGSLLFRAYYRGARLARVMVAIGVAALGAWFVASKGHESLVMLEGHWQSWAPAGAHMTFGLLALLALMAFMESSTRGGSHVWAGALLVLYAIHIGLLVASAVWPGPGSDASIEGPTIAAIFTGMVGTVVAGLALAQVLVVAYRKASARIKGRASRAS